MQSREGVDGLGTAAWKWTQGRARSKERGRRERMAGLWLRGGRKGKEEGGRQGVGRFCDFERSRVWAVCDGQEVVCR